MTGLSERFNEALMLAASLHRDDVRKGTSIPYIAHLLGVCELVLSDGGDEDEAIAALLQGEWPRSIVNPTVVPKRPLRRIEFHHSL